MSMCDKYLLICTVSDKTVSQFELCLHVILLLVQTQNYFQIIRLFSDTKKVDRGQLLTPWLPVKIFVGKH